MFQINFFHWCYYRALRSFGHLGMVKTSVLLSKIRPISKSDAHQKILILVFDTSIFILYLINLDSFHERYQSARKCEKVKISFVGGSDHCALIISESSLSNLTRMKLQSGLEIQRLQ